MTQRVIAFICTLLLICSCSAPPVLYSSYYADPVVDVNVYISPELSNETQLNIVAGIMLWERSLKGLMTWKLVSASMPGNEIMSRKPIQKRYVTFDITSEQETWVVKYDNTHDSRLLGMYVGDSLQEYATIWLIVDRLHNKNAETIIAAHEFGHALGLDHVEDKVSVLSRLYAFDVNELSKFDVREFCDHYDCLR